MLNMAFKQRSSYGRKRQKFTGKERDAETGLYYYGARYLDPKTGRWLSGDPAMGEYLPSAPVNDEAKKRNGNLPGQGGVFNHVNLHAYHYAGNNPVKYTDPTGRNLDEIANAEASIQQNATNKYKLSDLVNTDKLAGLIVNNRGNSDYVDDAVSRGIGNMSQAELSAFLGDMNVYAVSDWSEVEGALNALGMPMAPGGGDMLSVGNNIYVRDTMDLNSMNDNTANLLGHEAIHGLQAAGLGQSAFFSSYQQTGSYSNNFENTAYNWGGNSRLATSPQILPANPGWWRR